MSGTRTAETHIGKTYHRLTVLRILRRNDRCEPVVECQCSCGVMKEFGLWGIVRGDTKSCGCLLRDTLSVPTEFRESTGRKRAYSSPEAKRESQKKWRLNNPEKVAATAKKFRDKHAEKVKSLKAEYFQREKAVITAGRKHRRKTDPIYNLTGKLTSRIKRTLKGKRKDRSAIKYLGCSVEHARNHIQSLFMEGMTWELFMIGKIHIDHIKPIRSFNMNDISQREMAYHYTNLQPLWAKDNLSKSDLLPDGTRARFIKHSAP